MQSFIILDFILQVLNLLCFLYTESMIDFDLLYCI